MLRAKQLTVWVDSAAGSRKADAILGVSGLAGAAKALRGI